MNNDQAILAQNPTTTDLLQANRFSFTIKKLPNVNFFCQQAELPGVTLPAITQPNLFSNIQVAGNKLEFSNTFSIIFKLDEGMNNWREIYTWMAALGQPRKHAALRELQDKNNDGTGEYSDAMLTIKSPKGNSTIRVKLFRCFPISLSGITFKSDVNDVEQPTATVQFSFTTFEIESI